MPSIKIYLHRASPRNFYFKKSRTSEITVRLSELFALRLKKKNTKKKKTNRLLKHCLREVVFMCPLQVAERVSCGPCDMQLFLVHRNITTAQKSTQDKQNVITGTKQDMASAS